MMFISLFANFFFFFLNDTPTTEIYPLPLHDALPIYIVKCRPPENRQPQYDEIAACVPYLFRQIELIKPQVILAMGGTAAQTLLNTKQALGALRDRKSTRLNSSHSQISYAVFCLKKKK